MGRKIRAVERPSPRVWPLSAEVETMASDGYSRVGISDKQRRAARFSLQGVEKSAA